jgi:hypothetical protein
MDNSILRIDNLHFGKSKTKWEVIGKLSEVYLKTGNMLRVDGLVHQLKEQGIPVTTQEPYENYRKEVLELIKILANSPEG